MLLTLTLTLLLWLIHSIYVTKPPGNFNLHVCTQVECLLVSHKPSVPTGQLGNSGGPARRLRQCPGAPETGGLHAKEKKVAHEGLAQGTVRHL